MSQERWQTVEGLFHAALERPQEQRQAWLDGACDGDTELRGQVERLLSNEGRAGSFLERPAIEDVTVTQTAASSSWAGNSDPTRSRPCSARAVWERYTARTTASLGGMSPSRHCRMSLRATRSGWLASAARRVRWRR